VADVLDLRAGFSRIRHRLDLLLRLTPAWEGSPVSAASLLVLVRSTADLPRACAELSGLLALQRRHGAAAQEALLGLWVDPRGVERIPGELRWRARDGRRGAACIVETAGVEGIWMLCRMEVPEASPALSRHALLRSLATTFEPVDTDPLPAFFPVFRFDAPASEVQAEARRLVTEHAALVHAPLFQDPSSGWLESPTVNRAPGDRVRGLHAELGHDSLGGSDCASRAGNYERRH
jgi:hypothetical protein